MTPTPTASRHPVRFLSESTFRGSPRFGYTDQFSDLFVEDKAPDYVVGVVITALILGVAFLCWFLFVMILKCMGKNRVGFLSGAPFDEKINGQPSSRPFVGRLVFGLAGLTYIIFTFCLIFLGFGGLETTTDELGAGANLGAEIFTDVTRLLTTFLAFAVAAGEIRDSVVEAVEDIFELRANATVAPATGNNATILPNNMLPNQGENLPNGTSLALIGGQASIVDEALFIFDGINLREEAKTVVESLKALDDFIDEPTNALLNVTQEGETTCRDVSDGLTDAQVDFLQVFFGVPYTIIPFFMNSLMFATAVGLGKRSSFKNCCTSWVIMPLFVLFTFFLIVFTVGTSIAGIINADFCSGGESQSPEGTLSQILQNSGVPPTDIKYQVTDYLIHGCEFSELEAQFIEGDNPLAVYEDFIVDLENATGTISLLEETLLEIGIEEVARRLVANITNMDERLTRMEERTVELFDTMGQVVEDIACVRLYEIYNKVINDATCTASYDGLVWMFASFLVMAGSGMLMMTFRAVLYPLTERDDADDYSWNEVKDQEAQAMKEAPVGGSDDNMEGYTVQTGIEPGSDPPINKAIDGDDKPPAGGSATAAYQAVGDENPFADTEPMGGGTSQQ